MSEDDEIVKKIIENIEASIKEGLEENRFKNDLKEIIHYFLEGIVK